MPEEEKPLRFQSAEKVREFVDKNQDPWPRVTYWGNTGESPPYFTIVMAFVFTLIFVLIK